MKLLHYPHAPYTRKVLLAAYEKEVAFDEQICAPFEREAKAALKAIHPLGTVPLLVSDDGELLTESSIIVEHFDMISDRGPRLVPRDPREALRVRALDRFSDSHLMGPTAYLAWAMRKPAETQNSEKIRAQLGVVETALGIADERLARHAFMAGDALTMADLSPVAALACQLSDGSLKNLERWPNVTRWYEAMLARPSYDRLRRACAKVALPPGF